MSRPYLRPRKRSVLVRIICFALTKKSGVAHLLMCECDDMEMADAEGVAALFFHIQLPYYKSVLQWLLAVGVNVDHVNKAGSPIRHWTVRWCDESLVNLLCGANLRNVHVD